MNATDDYGDVYTAERWMPVKQTGDRVTRENRIVFWTVLIVTVGIASFIAGVLAAEKFETFDSRAASRAMRNFTKCDRCGSMVDMTYDIAGPDGTRSHVCRGCYWEGVSLRLMQRDADRKAADD